MTLFCSFCGKAQDEVAKLIAGPAVYICVECVDLCHTIVHGKPDEVAPAIDTDSSLAVADRELGEIRTMAQNLEHRIARLRSEIQRPQRPPSGPGEIIGFDEAALNH